MPLYHQGSTGKEVKQIQAGLQQLGHYQGMIDGDYGPGTVKGIKAFQRSKGLEADGKVGDKTGEILFSGSEPKPATAGPMTPSDKTITRNTQKLSQIPPASRRSGTRSNDGVMKDFLKIPSRTRAA